MGEKENLAVATRYWENWTNPDLTVVRELLSEDCIQEWPQSGERIRGKANIIAISENYPGLPRSTLKRAAAGGKLVVGEVQLDYGHKIYDCVSILEIKGGKIVHEVEYYAEPFQAPPWRSQWVERM
jgi:ketosteroid isomerase-like protein